MFDSAHSSYVGVRVRGDWEGLGQDHYFSGRSHQPKIKKIVFIKRKKWNHSV